MNTSRTFVESVSRSRDNLIYLVHGPDTTGRQAWYFIQVELKKQPLFKKAMQSSDANLGDFGEVLASGYGASPPAFILQRMKEEYGFEVSDT